MATTVYEGHVLDVLRGIPDESFHCCITSPPYWGLRDYGLPPMMWGGEAGCKHTWKEFERSGMGGGHSAKQESNKGSWHIPSRQATCSQCGAWRGSLGLEPTPDLYVEHLVGIFREVRRVLRSDGTLWLTMGDTYNSSPGGYARSHQKSGWSPSKAAITGRNTRIDGIKIKDLAGIPWLVAFALRADGWWLRRDIIWHKPNPMPESVRDRPTGAHEYVFLLSKSRRYFYDLESIKIPSAHPRDNRKTRSKELQKRMPTEKIAGMRPGSAVYPTHNRRTVWTIPTHPFPKAHFATFPPKLVEPMIKAGTSEKGCCPKCGKAWARVTEIKNKSRTLGDPAKYKNRPTPRDPREYRGGGRAGAPTIATCGWCLTCNCNAGEPVPCTILDPFGGAGTVALVAERLGRDTVLIDLNPGYVQMARDRIVGDAPLFNSVEIIRGLS